MGRFAMANDGNGANAPAKKSGAKGFDKIVIGIVVLGVAAALTYQVFFCSTCYGITQKYAPPAVRTNTQ
jgi:hypothetical protein